MRPGGGVGWVVDVSIIVVFVFSVCFGLSGFDILIFIVIYRIIHIT